MKKTRKNPRGKRPNPARELPGLTEMLTDIAGDLTIKSAMVGCSFSEKVIVAAFIPEFVRILRHAGVKDLQKAAESILDNVTAGEPALSHRAATPELRKTE